MQWLLRPERLDLDEKATNAEEDYSHWLKTFENFLAAIRESNENVNELQVLVNYITPKVYHHITDVTTYDQAKTALNSLFVKPKKHYLRKVHAVV